LEPPHVDDRTSFKHIETSALIENESLHRDYLKDYEDSIVRNISSVNTADLLPNDADRVKCSGDGSGSGYNVGDLLHMPVFFTYWNTSKQKERHVCIQEKLPTSIVGQYYTLKNPKTCNLDPDVTRLRLALTGSEAKHRVNPLQVKALQQQDTITVHLRSGDKVGQSDALASEVLEVTRQLNCLHSKPCRIVVLTRLHAQRVSLTKGGIGRMRGDLIGFKESLHKRHINATVEFWRGGSRRTDDDIFLTAMASHLVVHHGGFSALAGILSHGLVYFSSRMFQFITNPHYMMQIRHIGHAFRRNDLHLTLDRALNYTQSCCEFSDGLCTNALGSTGCWVWTFIGNSLQDKNCHLVGFNCHNAQLKSKNQGSPKVQSCLEPLLDTYLEKVNYFKSPPRALYVDGHVVKEAIQLINFSANVTVEGRPTKMDARPQQVVFQMPTRQSEAIIWFAENLELRHDYVLVHRKDVSQVTSLSFVKQSLLPL